MKFVFILLSLVGCTLTTTPADYVGPGAYCQPLSEYRQRCRDRFERPWICNVTGASWKCYREYPDSRY